METKIQKEFIDNGFGFPVHLRNVPMVKVRGEWTPKVNYNHLAESLLHALSFKPTRLTGLEIHFIRNHFEMTLKEFSKRFCVSHVAVMKWEKVKVLLNNKCNSVTICWLYENRKFSRKNSRVY